MEFLFQNLYTSIAVIATYFAKVMAVNIQL